MCFVQFSQGCTDLFNRETKQPQECGPTQENQLLWTGVFTSTSRSKVTPSRTAKVCAREDRWFDRRVLWNSAENSAQQVKTHPHLCKTLLCPGWQSDPNNRRKVFQLTFRETLRDYWNLDEQESSWACRHLPAEADRHVCLHTRPSVQVQSAFWCQFHSGCSANKNQLSLIQIDPAPSVLENSWLDTHAAHLEIRRGCEQVSSVSEKSQIFIAEGHRHVDDAASLGTEPWRTLKTDM